MNTKPGVYGTKLGFTQIFKADGTISRVTVVEAGPITLLGKRTIAKDGYSALVLAFGERKDKHTTKPVRGQYENAEKRPDWKGLYGDAKTTAKRVVKELRAPEDFVAKFEVGQAVKLDEVFSEGQYVDARGTTRGRGFSGVIRRWSFAGFVSSHGTHEYFRHGGSIGTNMTPGRTLPNLKMPGQYGNETVSTLNLKIAKIDAEKNQLLIEGAVPGPKNGLVLIRHAVKKKPFVKK